MRNRVLILAFCLAFASMGRAGVFEDGASAYQRGDYETAYRIWEPLALDGNPQAQYNLGMMYWKGLGVPQNLQESANWYRRAAEQNLGAAQYNLGFMYETGKGVNQNYQQAAEWYREAAKQGDLQAQTNLGAIYYLGRGVARDYVEAHAWFSLAANRGDENARRNRDIVEKVMTSEQISEATKLSERWAVLYGEE